MALFQRPTPDKIRSALQLTRYAPELKLTSIVLGVDNIRHDVRLSPRLIAFCAPYVLQLLIKHSNTRRLFDDPGPTPGPAERSEFKRMMQELLIGVLSQARARQNVEIDLLAEVALFKYLGWELLRQYGVILLQGKDRMKMYEDPKHMRNPKAFELKQIFSDFQTQKKVFLRLVAQELQRSVNEVQADAVRKTRESFFGSETGSLYPYFSNPLIFTDNGRDDFIHLEKYVMVGNFQKDPDRFEFIEEWLRGFVKMVDQAGPEARELALHQEKQEKLAAEMVTLRNATVPQQQQKSSSVGRLISGFTGAIPVQTAKPPAADLSNKVADLVDQIFTTAEEVRVLSTAYETQVGEMLNVPENVDEMVGASRTEQSIADAKKRGAGRNELGPLEERLEVQRYLLDEFYRAAEKAGLLLFMAAAYEAARIYADYCPPINPQSMKTALLQPEERKKVAALVSHFKLPENRLAVLEDAATRVQNLGPRDLRMALVRYITDYTRHHRDVHHLTVFQGLSEKIQLVMDERTERLSRVNGQLYEFLLPTEEQVVERKITGHVIMKADIRDSTRLTQELLARGLNPASYFSLNFYEPLNRILPRYGAEKVFIEGDAVILSLFEQEGGGGQAVALACGLAREMTEIVRLYNTKSEAGGLPRLEIGIGITYRNSAPLFLFDGQARIMISDALNLSDRLSGCSKLARKSLPENTSLFNVYIMQTITEETAAGAMEEFLVRYNVYGICLSEDAFEKLRTELNFNPVNLELPLLWGNEKVTLHCGSVPISNDVYQRLVVREGLVPFVDPQTWALKEITKRRYFEVCTNRLVYEYTEKMLSS